MFLPFSERRCADWMNVQACNSTPGAYISQISGEYSSRMGARDKRAKFVELATNRVNRAIKDLRLVGNLANRSSYEYTDDDAKKILRVLQRELDDLKLRFKGIEESDDRLFTL